MKKALVAIVSLLLAMGSTAAPAMASGNESDWAGNGSSESNGNFSISEQCSNGEYDGTYLLWVLTASKATKASIDLDGPGGSAPVAMTKMGGGSFHYVQTFPDTFVRPMVGLVAAFYDGIYKKATLTLSHGCLPEYSMAVHKTITSAAPQTVGDVITYQISVENTSNINLHNVNVSDPNATITDCSVSLPLETFNRGDSFTCNASHTVTTDDMNAGVVYNTAEATSDEDDEESNPTSQPIFVAQPSINIFKSLTSAPVYKVGDVATYHLVVTNNGNVPLTNVNVTDPKATITSCSVDVPVASLAVGASFTCEASHTVTDADFDTNGFTNIAHASSDQTSEDSNPVDSPLTPAPALTIYKSSLNGASGIGDVLNYNITVQNTGNVTVHNVGVVDGNATLGDCTIAQAAVTLPVDLEVGSQLDCAASHTVTEADMLAGIVINTAHTTSDNANEADSNEVDNPLTAAPSLNVVKSLTSSAPSKVGDVITYQINVTNNGNIPLHNVTLSDPNATIDSCSVTLPVDLALGDGFICSVSHVVTDADMTAGSVTNIATANSNETNNNSNPVVSPLVAAPSMSVIKSITNAAPTTVGDTIAYQIVVTNNGNVTLHNVAVTDAYAVVDSCDTAAPVTLAIGASLTCLAHHVTTDADFLATHYDNTANAASDEKTQDSNTVITPLTYSPSIAIVKSITNVTNPSKPGDVITYSFLITNNGNVTLHNLSLSDGNAVIDTYSISGTINLLPGDSLTVTAHHVTTNADFVAGHYNNTGTVTTDEATKTSNTVVTHLDALPALELSKIQTSADPVHVGDIITYSITAHNAGNIILHNVVVTDPNGDNLSCSPAVPVDLAMDGWITCTAQHVATSADFDNGSYTNTAYASSDEISADPSTVITPLQPTPALDVNKSLDGPVPTKVGDVIHYIIVVGNTGNVDLTGVTLTDANAELTDCLTAFDLAYAAQVTCHAVHTVTASDFATGYYDNVARAQVGNTNADSNLVHITLAAGPAISVAKRLTGNPPTKTGDVAHYLIVVSNTGNVDLTNVTVTDPNATFVACSPARPATLLVGESMTCTATHTATDADFDAGKIDNVATATADQTSANSNLVHLPLVMAANMTITKRVYGAAPTKIGDVINYRVVYTNTGNVNLHNVVVTDANGSFVNCDDVTTVVTRHVATTPVLALGASVTCRVTHTVTARDAANGRVVNVAAAVTDENLSVSSSAGSNGLNSNQVVTKLRYNGGTTLSVINATGFTGGTLAFTGGEENLANDGTLFYGMLVAGAVALAIRRRIVKSAR